MSRFIQKDPQADLKSKYQKVLEISTIITLALIIILFYSFKKFEVKASLIETPDVPVEAIDIPQTQQFDKPPPPPKPSIPVEAEDDELLEDVTIEDTEVSFDSFDDEPPPPPSSDDDEIFEFFAVSEKPKAIKQATPKYPDLARRANIEGRVVVTVTIGKDGKVENAVIFASDASMLNEAALEAAKQFEFTPAKQRDKTVRVKMNLPFNFTLKN
jgi:protein TonB